MSTPKTPSRNPRAAEKSQLDRDAWLDAAAAAIAEGGFENVRVLTLAKRLGVTRGSFYWHFRDHGELIASFLNRWRDRRMAELEFLRQNHSDTEPVLHHIFRLILSEPARNTRQMRVELAVRDYARRDAYAAKIVGEIDRLRIDQWASMLEKVIATKEQARDLALLFYVTTIGGRVLLTSFRDGEATINRIEKLIAEIVPTKEKSAIKL